jgi:hypothetical protein
MQVLAILIFWELYDYKKTLIIVFLLVSHKVTAQKVGQLTCKLSDNDLEKADCIDLAQDRDQFSAFANIVMNLWTS